MEKLDKDINYTLEKALLLSPEQTKAFRSFNFVITGFYGVGKTIALEVAIDKIVFKPEEFPSAQIIFVGWDQSQELKQRFKQKFDGIRNQKYPHLSETDSLQVFSSVMEICIAYRIDMKCFTNKVDVINCLCTKLQGE